MKRPSRKGRGKPLLAGHQKSWLWGRVAVLETLAAQRWPVVELLLADGLDEDGRDAAAALAEAAGAAVRTEPAARLTQLCHAPEHQGYLAKMGPFPYADPEALLAAPPPAPLYALLDGLQDPHNFGAIVRSAEVFGVTALFIGEEAQSPVTTAVARSSAGAVNRIAIARAPDLLAVVERLRGDGVAVIGASERAAASIADCDFARPVCIIIGNEAAGIRADLRHRCDALARIPQHGRIGSLNAAAAAAIIFYEAQRQRRTGDGNGKRGGCRDGMR